MTTTNDDATTIPETPSAIAAAPNAPEGETPIPHDEVHPSSAKLAAAAAVPIPAPVPQPGPMDHSFGSWAEDELRHVEELAERVAAKVHAKLAPLFEKLSTFDVGDAIKALDAHAAPLVSAAKAAIAAAQDAAPVAREFKCIADGLLCPMHGVIHES